MMTMVKNENKMQIGQRKEQTDTDYPGAILENARKPRAKLANYILINYAPQSSLAGWRSFKLAG